MYFVYPIDRHFVVYLPLYDYKKSKMYYHV